MKRRLLNVLAVVAVLALVPIAVLWARSYRFPKNRTGESLSFTRSDPLWWVVSYRGTLTLCRQNGKDWGEEFGDIEALGFGFGGLSGPNGSLWNLRVPYWFVSAALLVPPAAWVVATRRARRMRRGGRCAACGYDLRASEGRCPECGLPFPSPPGPA
jgi:hypothetical protein